MMEVRRTKREDALVAPVHDSEWEDVFRQEYPPIPEDLFDPHSRGE